MLVKQPIQEAAEQFIRECYAELGKGPEELRRRLDEIDESIATTGTYEHTFEELEQGAKLAWRNSNRCIGRLFWESLQVRDARAAATTEEMADALLRHIEEATNGGRVLPMITVFRAVRPGEAGPRVWNHQLIRYAGYRTEDGILGDPITADLTAWCMKLGWKGNGTRFDVLPLVLQMGEEPPRAYEVPPSIVAEVPIRHPELAEFDSLGLKWYGVPFVANMRLEIGGLQYTAAPFNGWYMGTEIGARNLADPQRYDQLPAVARLMGLDTTRESTLWRDKALVELNVAVLHSYRQAGVTIVDHHTAAQQFTRFEEKEAAKGRPVTGDWTWLIPPVSPATTPIFHKGYDNRIVSPNFFYQHEPYPQ